MDWELSKNDRSFQFGRLLAVMERAEADYYQKSGEERTTNAIRSMSQFKQTPLTVFERVNAKLEDAYLPRMDGWAKNRYLRMRDEIVAILATCPDGGEKGLNKPLNEYYLMGYTLQRNAFFKRKENENGNPENTNDQLNEEE